MEQNNLYQACLEGPAPLPQNSLHPPSYANGGQTPNVPQFTSWADPLWNQGGQNYGASMKMYVCPNDVTAVNTTSTPNSYVYNHAIIRNQPKTQNYPLSITDGTSNTIFFTEVLYLCGVGPTVPNNWNNEFREGDRGWFNDIDNLGTNQPFNGQNSYPQFITTPQTCDYRAPSALHSGVINASMADGSVRTISSGVGKVTWAAAVSPQSGDVLGSDW
jgi:prepilin-type processing-associated H-X9-DG protein